MPQGSVLGPLLFILFFNAIVKDRGFVDVAMYADDIAAWYASKNLGVLQQKLQEFLDNIHAWTSQYRVKLNVGKSVYNMFTLNTKFNTIDLYFAGAKIAKDESPRFLGVTLDPRLTFTKYIDELVSRCNKRLNMMRSIRGRTWGASEKLLLTTYKALVRSLIDYAPIILILLPPSTLDRIEQVQREAARIVARAEHRAPTAEIFERLRLETIAKRSADMSISYWRNSIRENTLVREVKQAYEQDAPLREGAERQTTPRTTIIGRIIELEREWLQAHGMSSPSVFQMRF